MTTHFPSTRFVLVLALGSSMLFYAALGVYARHGMRLLGPLDSGIGEVLMKEGKRLEQAGSAEQAKEKYRAALAAGFAGAQNRVFTEKRLGVLLWTGGQFEEALPLLQAAASRENASLSDFPPLCAVLLELHRDAELKSVAERWRSYAQIQKDAASEAEACYFLGKAALLQGNQEQAETQFKEGHTLKKGGRCTVELGMHYFENGYPLEARRYLEAYLAEGASGPRAQRVREVLSQIR